MSSATGMQVLSDLDQAVVLMDPVRLRLVRELAEPDSAAGLARRLGVPRQRLNYHLRALEKAGLLELVAERRRRNCTERLLRATATTYVIDPAVLAGLGSDTDSVRDRFSWTYLLGVATRAIQELAWLRRQADKARQKLLTLTLDVQVRLAGPDRLNAFAEELGGFLAELVTRYHDEQAPQGRVFRCFVGMHPAITRPADAEPAARESAADSEQVIHPDTDEPTSANRG